MCSWCASYASGLVTAEAWVSHALCADTGAEMWSWNCLACCRCRLYLTVRPTMYTF
jgi:hypothetical protein